MYTKKKQREEKRVYQQEIMLRFQESAFSYISPHMKKPMYIVSSLTKIKSGTKVQNQTKGGMLIW
jgi:hypothetical protein